MDSPCHNSCEFEPNSTEYLNVFCGVSLFFESIV